ncbi:response regulator [Caenimonas sedimenti]|uniref:Response regulator n=1 Tax=Caenimonas sedimenti TaxID=2596921 RepID=A0A562ZNY4_9BURK|nr:response regulator [Caenimonas sedimenti]TWO70076.1 response regulator [Caenimonas sedimenti]
MPPEHAELITSHGHEVEVAHDGPEALGKAASFQPDVAFLDIGLPVMDGFELGRRLGDMPSQERLVMAAVTAYGQLQYTERFSECGFSAHLVKPVDINGLFAIVAQRAEFIPST